MLAYQLRQATIHDCPAILELWKGAAHWLLSKGISQWDPSYFTLDTVQDCFDDHSELYTAVYSNGTIIATVMVCWRDPDLWEELDQGDAGYIHRLIVHAGYSKQGIGAALLEWAQTYIRDRGKQYARLDCAADNLKLSQYYLDHGFTLLKVREWGKGWRSSMYQKPL